MSTVPPPTRPRAEVLADAVAALTEAARLTRFDADGRTEPADWAEFVTQALAGAAANVGGIERALTGRPGSWEADGVRTLLTSTVGHGEEYLLAHRTEPLVVTVYVDQILCDAGAWEAYDDAAAELGRRYDAIGIPTATYPAEAAVLLTPATDEQERQIEEIAVLQELLEQQRERDWAAYGQALKAHVEAAAADLPGLHVPIVVTVDLHTWPDGWDGWGWEDISDRLSTQAIQVTPLPAPEPLQRACGIGS